MRETLQSQSFDVGDYQNLLTEFIRKHIVAFGPQVAISKARKVEGLTLTDDGEVTAVDGDFKVILRHLLNEYMMLSAEITRSFLNELIAPYADGAIRSLGLSREDIQKSV